MNCSDFIQWCFKADDIANITWTVRLSQLSNMPMDCELILNTTNKIYLTRFEVLTQVLLKIQSTGIWCCFTGQVLPKIFRQLGSEYEGTRSFAMLGTEHIMVQYHIPEYRIFSEIYLVWKPYKGEFWETYRRLWERISIPSVTLWNFWTQLIWHICLQRFVHQQPSCKPLSAVQSCTIHKPARPTLWSRVTANFYTTSHTHTHYGQPLPTLTVPHKHRVQVICNTQCLT
jgi:hypothetical protein